MCECRHLYLVCRVGEDVLEHGCARQVWWSFICFIPSALLLHYGGGSGGVYIYIYIRITASICLGFAQTLPSELPSCLPARSGLLSSRSRSQ